MREKKECEQWHRTLHWQPDKEDRIVGAWVAGNVTNAQRPTVSTSPVTESASRVCTYIRIRAACAHDDCSTPSRSSRNTPACPRQMKYRATRIARDLSKGPDRRAQSASLCSADRSSVSAGKQKPDTHEGRRKVKNTRIPPPSLLPYLRFLELTPRRGSLLRRGASLPRLNH